MYVSVHYLCKLYIPVSQLHRHLLVIIFMLCVIVPVVLYVLSSLQFYMILLSTMLPPCVVAILLRFVSVINLQSSPQRARRVHRNRNRSKTVPVNASSFESTV